MSKRIYNLAIFIENEEVERKRKKLESINKCPYNDLNDGLKKYFIDNITYHFIIKSLKPYKMNLSEEECIKLDEIHTKKMSVFLGKPELSHNVLYPSDYEEWFVDLDDENDNKIKYIETDELYNNFKNNYYKGGFSDGDCFENKKIDIEHIWNYFSIEGWVKYMINKDGIETNFEKIKDVDNETLHYIPSNINAAIIDNNWHKDNGYPFKNTIDHYLEEYRDTHTIITTTCYMVSQDKLKEILT